MLLKVGELAKRTGLTVRALHHYDSIGLLTASTRSDAGYRLYNRNDIARLHAVQALRQIGLPLHEISSLLSGKPEPLPLIIQRQITAIEHQIEQASELCARLNLLQSRLAKGNEPDMADWLSTLASMSAYGKYFTASEIKKIFENWKPIEAKWPPLIAAIRNAMDRGVPPESLEIQPLARRWMDLNFRWMKGDFELMERWGQMYLREPAAQGKNGVDLEMVEYIGKASDLRAKALHKYFSKDELRRFNVELEDEWHMLADEIGKLVKKNVPPKSKKAQDAAGKWSDLIDRMVNHDPVLRQKLMTAGPDPVLRASSILGPELITFVRDAWMAGCKKSA